MGVFLGRGPSSDWWSGRRRVPTRNFAYPRSPEMLPDLLSYYDIFFPGVNQCLQFLGSQLPNLLLLTLKYCLLVQILIGGDREW